MARIDPLQAALAVYAAQHWEDEDWKRFGRETGTSDILSGHPRLYRSLSFGDDDYPDAVQSVLGPVLEEGVEDSSGEAGRMELFADFMPDLPDWISKEAPPRTKRLFQDYLAARDASEIPVIWKQNSTQSEVKAQDDHSAEESAIPAIDTTGSPFDWGSAAAPTSAALPSPVDDEFNAPPKAARPETSLFIVHGHDEAALNSIRVYAYRETGKMPISLAEEPGRGQTIIEKFENKATAASYVIVLLTPDDVGQTASDHVAEKNPKPRARQNVVLELGYFIGKLGRENVVVIDAGVEHPSDLAGLSYISYPGENWKDSLRTELAAASLILRS